MAAAAVHGNGAGQGEEMGRRWGPGRVNAHGLVPAASAACRAAAAVYDSGATRSGQWGGPRGRGGEVPAEQRKARSWWVGAARLNVGTVWCHGAACSGAELSAIGRVQALGWRLNWTEIRWGDAELRLVRGWHLAGRPWEWGVCWQGATRALPPCTGCGALGGVDRARARSRLAWLASTRHGLVRA